MHSQLDKLTSEEKQSVLYAPALITILIASADGEIDEKEVTWAEKVTKFRTETAHHSLTEYYELVAATFHTDFAYLLKGFSIDSKERMAQVSAALSALNAPLSKIDEDMKERLLESFRTFARSVAETNEGILGFFMNNVEEEKVIKLEMLK
jgi:hypothetical protein